MTLDDKLKKLLPTKCIKRDLGEKCDNCDELIAQIKTAFAEANWSPLNIELTKGEVLMGGQAWFQRFEKELESIPEVDGQGNESHEAVLEAARKASNLE